MLCSNFECTRSFPLQFNEGSVCSVLSTLICTKYKLKINLLIFQVREVVFAKFNHPLVLLCPCLVKKEKKENKFNYFICRLYLFTQYFRFTFILPISLRMCLHLLRSKQKVPHHSLHFSLLIIITALIKLSFSCI